LLPVLVIALPALCNRSKAVGLHRHIADIALRGILQNSVSGFGHYWPSLRSASSGKGFSAACLSFRQGI
jgi:hypothetical protein